MKAGVAAGKAEEKILKQRADTTKVCHKNIVNAPNYKPVKYDLPKIIKNIHKYLNKIDKNNGRPISILNN